MLTGDILLIKYKRCPLSLLIRLFTKSEYNHVALVINKTQLVHIKAKGLSITSLKQYQNKFLYKAKLLRLKRRYKDRIVYLAGITRKVIAQQKRYSYFSFIKSGILLFLGKKVKREICSSFVARIYNEVGCRFNPQKELSQILPEDINKSKKLKDVTKEISSY